MRRGYTKTGFSYEYDESRLDDMRFLDLLVTVIDGDSGDLQIVSAASKIITMLLGPAQKARLYDHIAQLHEGKVPVAVVMEELSGIIQTDDDDTKN